MKITKKEDVIINEKYWYYDKGCPDEILHLKLDRITEDYFWLTQDSRPEENFAVCIRYLDFEDPTDVLYTSITELVSDIFQNKQNKCKECCEEDEYDE